MYSKFTQSQMFSQVESYISARLDDVKKNFSGEKARILRGAYADCSAKFLTSCSAEEAYNKLKEEDCQMADWLWANPNSNACDAVSTRRSAFGHVMAYMHNVFE